MHTQSGARVRGALSEARARGLEAADRGCPGAPDSRSSRRFPGNSEPEEGFFSTPGAKANSSLGAVSLPLPISPLCPSPLPLAPVLGPRPPGVPTSPLPPPPGSFSSGGGGVGEGQRRKPGRRGWGWGRGHGELFTRKSRGSVFEPPGPRPGCIVLARALGASGGRSEVRQPGGRRAALCWVCAPRPPPGRLRARRSRAGPFLTLSQRSNLDLPRRLQSPRSQPAERASDRGWAAGDERPEKVTVVARFLPSGGRSFFAIYM